MKIKELREKSHLSREVLSEMVGISKETLARYERGTREPRASDIKKLCEVLQVSETELLNGPSEEEIEVTVKFYEKDFWEVSDMNLATNTAGSFVVSFGPDTMGIETRGRWETEDDVRRAFEVAKERALEIFRVQKCWVKDGEVSLSNEISNSEEIGNLPKKKSFAQRQRDAVGKNKGR